MQNFKKSPITPINLLIHSFSKFSYESMEVKYTQNILPLKFFPLKYYLYLTILIHHRSIVRLLSIPNQFRTLLFNNQYRSKKLFIMMCH
jgi:hypothetical protein